ncbi:MAG: N-acetyltransferase [Oscillospiraceae bacterium]|jgi:predicted N-acetyltransferase YhbS|nr:N-acetyltransferase [Oscillospiraceae bacterium]
MSGITLRLEEPRDYRAVEELTREAFGADSGSCDEHLLAHKLRKISGFVPELDYVAEIDGELAGNILYSKSKIVSDSGIETEVLTFGPLSVLPKFQNLGVGKALIRRTISEAKRLGYRAVVIFGHPDYYPRSGFRRAAEFGLTTPDGETFDAFMALPLYDGALDGVSGRFYEDKVYHSLGEEELADFEKNFTPKEPPVWTPIEALYQRLSPKARDALSAKFKDVRVLRDLTGISQDEMSSLADIDADEISIIKAVMRENGYRWGK